MWGCPLGRQHNGAGGCSEPPWLSLPGAQPHLKPLHQLPRGFTGVGAASLPRQVPQGWQVVCAGGRESKQHLPGHIPHFGQSCLSAGLAISAIRLSGACCLPARSKSCLWLQGCCEDLPGNAHGQQPSSFPADAFQGLPFTAETVQLIALVGCSAHQRQPGSIPTPLGCSGSRRPRAPRRLF